MNTLSSCELASVHGGGRAADVQEWGVLPVPPELLRRSRRFGRGLVTGITLTVSGAVALIGVGLRSRYKR